MKVLHVLPSIDPHAREWGGVTQAGLALARALSRRGFQVTLMSTHRCCPLSVEESGAFHLRSFPTSPLERWWRGHSWPLGAALRQAALSCDIVHIHDLFNYSTFAAGRAAQRVRRPYVLSAHGSLQPAALAHRRFRKTIYHLALQRQLLCGASGLHALTEAEEEQLRRRSGGRPVAMIPNGLEPTTYEPLPPREELDAFFPELKGRRVVLFLGRLHPIKGLDLLAASFRRIAQDRNDVRLVLAGPDPDGYLKWVHSVLQAEGVADRTLLTGMVEGRQKLALLGGAAVLVLPSRSEVRGLVTLEAMLCKVPVVISRECGFPEVEESKAGLVVDRSPAELARALVALLDTPQLGREMGENGRRLVLERFTWDKIADRMGAFYQDVWRSGPR